MAGVVFPDRHVDEPALEGPLAAAGGRPPKEAGPEWCTSGMGTASRVRIRVRVESDKGTDNRDKGTGSLIRVQIIGIRVRVV